MASSISFSVVGANLPPITLSMNTDANAPTRNASKLSVRDKIPDFFFEKLGI